MKKLLFSLLLVSLCACSANSSNITHSSGPKKLETLYFVDVKEKSIDVSVISTGCTSAKDFKIESQKIEEACQVGIYRLNPDFCRKQPEKKVLSLPWDRKESCGDAPIKIKNSVEHTKNVFELK